MAAVELKGVSMKFGRVDAIKSIDLEIPDQEFLVLVGPSGCGKSTLLRTIAGLEEPTEGEILIDGVRVNDLPVVARGVAMVFQSYALYPHLTVSENMGLALRIAGVPKAERANKVLAAARILRIEDLLARKPRELSGGQSQRVAIGRAIVREPKVFLFDEPLSNLDAALRAQMRIELANLHQTLRTTMIFVTHDQIEAMTLAERIVVLNAGKIEQVGTPLELYREPRNLFVAEFIGSPKMNLLHASVRQVSGRVVQVVLPGGRPFDIPIERADLAVGDSVTVGLRPEVLSIADGGFLSGTVMVIEQLGSQVMLHVDIGEGTLVTVQCPSDQPTRVGDRTSVSLVEHPRINLFDSKGVAVQTCADAPPAKGREHLI